MRRRYELKKRAERQAETRRRIVEAAVGLHSTIGPARTTIGAIAERAGVQRSTVYSHFPDQGSLFDACSGHNYATDPPPDASRWSRVEDPEARLWGALLELYAYYRRNRTLFANVVRDSSLMPIVAEVSVPLQETLRRLEETLLRGWGVHGRRRAKLTAVLGHALEFGTWDSLAGRQRLSDEETVAAMISLVRHAVDSDLAAGAAP